MDKHVENDFRRILGLAPDAKIPGSLEHAHDACAHASSVCSSGRFTPRELILLCFITGHLKLTKEEQERLRKEQERQTGSAAKYFPGESVRLKHQGQEVVAKIVKVEGEEVQVTIEGDAAKYRKVPLKDIIGSVE